MQISEEMDGDFVASPYRISTMTITGGVNTDISLQKLYDSLTKEPPKEISYIEFGQNKHEFQSFGYHSKHSKKKKKTDKPKKRFDNQLTLVVSYEENPNQKHNLKLFKNGNVQMTGVKSLNDGRKSIDYLIIVLKKQNEICPGIVKDIEQIENVNYKIRLINCDFKINFEIRLDHLYKLITSKIGIVCSYEPCIYPGAKIEYYFPNNGFCKCTTFCNGKSENCKKITIAVFQSGCIIITGANTIEHINVAYEFICNVLKSNKYDIKRNKLQIPSLK
jgi:TATA-box binding protein (TBP) (component of TFIID and TFIIIB)